MKMPEFRFTQIIQQLEKRQGGYHFLKINANVVSQFDKGRHTRLRCNLDEQHEFSCGLNHLGDGNYFIILSGKNLKKVNKELGDEIHFRIYEDPNPLGVEIPEVLQVLMDQDVSARETFNKITDGKKRSLIYTIQPVKDVDKQVRIILDFLEKCQLKLEKKR